MQTSVTIPADSSWFSGHFPGKPILPGIAQLEMVVRLISESTRIPLRLTGLHRVKFRKIVRPGDLLDIRVIPGSADDQYLFRITGNGEDVCSGSMFLSQPSPSKGLHEQRSEPDYQPGC